MIFINIYIPMHAVYSICIIYGLASPTKLKSQHLDRSYGIQLICTLDIELPNDF